MLNERAMSGKFLESRWRNTVAGKYADAFRDLCAFRKTFKRHPINILIEYGLKCLLLYGPRYGRVTRIENRAGARTLLEFPQNVRSSSIRLQVKYSSLLVEKQENRPTSYCICTPLRILARALHSRFSRSIQCYRSFSKNEEESKFSVHRLFVPLPTAFIAFALKDMNHDRNM